MKSKAKRVKLPTSGTEREDQGALCLQTALRLTLVPARNLRAKRLAIAIVAGLHWLLASQALSTSYSVKGRFTYETIIPGHPVPALDREFEVVVNGSEWSVKVVLVGNKEFDSFVSSYDGTNLVSYFVLAKKVAASAAGTVEQVPVPHTATSAAGEFAWLAFASGRYFMGLTNHAALSFRLLKSPGGLVRRYEQPCRFTLRPEPPHLPTRVEYLLNQLVFLTDEGKTVTQSLAPPFEAGYVAAEFSASAFTNAGGLWLPTEFQYNGYQPRPGAKAASDLLCTLRVRGFATSVSVGEASWAGLPRGKVFLEDRRVPEAGVLYPITNGTVPLAGSEEVAKARVRARRINAEAERRPAAGHPLRRLVVIGCLVVSALPLIYLCRRSETRRNTSRKVVL